MTAGEARASRWILVPYPSTLTIEFDVGTFSHW
jgi:hypothetical protein